MQTWRKQLTDLSVAMLFGVAGASALAQTTPLPAGTFATVNGEPLSDALLDVNVQANVTQGRADSPQLREVIKNELVGREVLAQEAQKLKLDQTGPAQAQLAQLKQNFLANLLINHYNTTNPVTEAAIKAEYDAFLKDVDGAKQYQLSLIVVATEARAKAMIAEINKSKDKGLFTKLAADESIDASRADQGKIDWLLPEQMLPAVGNVVANLNEGRVSAVPIQTRAGWNVIRVDGIRDFTPPAMADIESQLREAALQKQLSGYIQTLQAEATIVQ